MNNKQLERWSPLLLLLAIIVIWEVIIRVFGVSEWLCSRKLWSSSSDEPEAADTGCSGADAPSH